MAELPTGNWGFWLWVQSAAGIWRPAVSKNESVRRLQYKTSRNIWGRPFSGQIPANRNSLVLWGLKTTWMRMTVNWQSSLLVRKEPREQNNKQQMSRQWANTGIWEVSLMGKEGGGTGSFQLVILKVEVQIVPLLWK